MASPTERSTEARILDSAIIEFAQRGFAGARVQAIADDARANIRMIYHYFQSKEGLFRAVMHEVSRRRAAELREMMSTPPTTLEELAVIFFDSYSRQPLGTRLLQWEALEFDRSDKADADDSWVNAEERSRAATERVELIRRMQAAGHLDAEIDPESLYVALVGIALSPLVFPALVGSATGQHGSDPEFRERYRRTIATLANQIAPGKALGSK
ncbi:TetR family transcriptional regulator [Pseudoclavibacter endophyticus]|uniref:TetR/AcrR family transcriptional regulator n=1 Tax=Pseudoclavibacter endophyticus TaxID=1778590 RepID=A0A6H9WHJ0_9MICO|nr:TetR/AcrR family transcriptional regulator [Pseudoclavibacter endophyticus]KAB1648763.1 TetR/AcrR family transcriptional regulator [Pseudoclavibacter endophyticus]GGA68711.1 TetR family transcriptional regulator [Pseudoclavibacter endophyticus]